MLNLRLAYRGPNSTEGKAGKTIIRRIDKDRIPPDATTELRKFVDYSQGSKEMQANAEAEPFYRALMWEFILTNSRITKDRAINGMAEKIGVSQQATRDYLKKAASEDGPFMETRKTRKEGGDGIKYIIIRPGRLT